MSTGEAATDGTLRLIVEGHSDLFAARDERAAQEAYELQQALERAVPEHIERRPSEGDKGVVTEVIVPIATSGALTAMTEAFKAWLGKKPTHRSISVRYEVDEGSSATRKGDLDVDATNVDDAVLDTIAREVLGPGK